MKGLDVARKAFPTSKLTPGEIEDGWTMCDDPNCKPTLSGRRIIGPHAHLDADLSCKVTP